VTSDRRNGRNAIWGIAIIDEICDFVFDIFSGVDFPLWLFLIFRFLRLFSMRLR